MTPLLYRKLREFWPDRNLRRRWDRTETVILGGLLAAFLICGALAALANPHEAAAADSGRETVNDPSR